MNFKLFEINKTAITLSSVLMFLVVIAVFAVTSRLLQRVLRAQIFSRLRIDEGIQYTLIRISHYVIMVIGAVVAFQFIGIDLTGLAIIVGFLSVGIGFGLQNITSNFVAGLILLFERPIKVGDRVMVGDQEGDVVEIKMRSTTIRTLNNIAVIVPNSEFVSSRLENWSYGDQKLRVDIDVGVSYGSDLETVMHSLREVAAEHPEVLKNPAPDVLHRGFGDSAWNMRLRVWLEHPRRHPEVHSDINCAIVRKFQQRGVEIPFPQRDLHVRSPLPAGTEFPRSA
ncbi:MAG: mechanosensitive ion channel [Deltaproteobacteria bacterium]|nr:MAG: mechanosensitive ion channel [Deltaproteobacteria bacterium]